MNVQLFFSLLVMAMVASASVAFVFPTAGRGRVAFVSKSSVLVLSEVEADVNSVDAVASDPISAVGSDSDADEAGGDEERRKVERARNTLFIGNLPFNTSDAAVKELFDKHGRVELVSVPRNRMSGQHRGFAFVDMATEEELDRAIAALDGAQFGGRVLRVTKSIPKDQVPKEDKKPELAEGVKKIYMGNIPFDITREEIMDFYKEFGEVIEVYVPVNNQTGKGRGFAFVTMADAAAEAAIAATNGKDFGGRKLVVSLPLPPGEKAPPRRGPPPQQDRVKLYIGNLSFYTVGDTLRDLFEEFGGVHDCYLPEDPSTGGSRGFGFVTMDREAANAAIAELDGCEVDGRIIRVNEAQPKRSNRNQD